MRIYLSLCITASLLILGNNVARSTDVELTGWPYQVDVVRENLGRFTSQSGLSATFNPFPSNEYHTKMVASFILEPILMWSMSGTVFSPSGPRQDGLFL